MKLVSASSPPRDMTGLTSNHSQQGSAWKLPTGRKVLWAGWELENMDGGECAEREEGFQVSVLNKLQEIHQNNPRERFQEDSLLGLFAVQRLLLFVSVAAMAVRCGRLLRYSAGKRSRRAVSQKSWGTGNRWRHTNYWCRGKKAGALKCLSTRHLLSLARWLNTIDIDVQLALSDFQPPSETRCEWVVLSSLAYSCTWRLFLGESKKMRLVARNTPLPSITWRYCTRQWNRSENWYLQYLIHWRFLQVFSCRWSNTCHAMQ